MCFGAICSLEQAFSWKGGEECALNKGWNFYNRRRTDLTRSQLPLFSLQCSCYGAMMGNTTVSFIGISSKILNH